MRSLYNLYRRLRKDGRRTYYVRVWDSTLGRYGRTLSTGATTKADAERYVKQLLDRGVVASSEDPALLPYLRSFWAPDSDYSRFKRSRGAPLSRRYLEINAWAIKHMLEPYETFARVRLSGLSPAVLEKWVRWAEDRGTGPRGINIAVQCVRTAVRRWAKGHRVADPLDGFQKLAEKAAERGVLSITEIRKLLDTREGVDPRVRAGVVVALTTGLRFSEVRGLEWQDVDEERGVVTVRQAIVTGKSDPTAPKWGSTGEVPLPEVAVMELQALLARSPHGRTGYVICDLDDPHKAIGTEALAGGFERFLKKMGISEEERQRRRLSFHSLRHSYVSLSRYAGLPDFITQRNARHRSAVMMEHYSHKEIIDFAEARAKLDAAMKAPKGKKAAGKES